MASFVGSWNTTRYKAEDPSNPELIVMTVTEDTAGGTLDGGYPRSGFDARMLGPFDGNNNFWTADFNEVGSSGDVGKVFFVLSADGYTIHGAWSSTQHNTGPQPWFGVRV